MIGEIESNLMNNGHKDYNSGRFNDIPTWINNTYVDKMRR